MRPRSRGTPVALRIIILFLCFFHLKNDCVISGLLGWVRALLREQVLMQLLPFSWIHSLYNNIKTPGQLQPSATFYLFKEGIEPKWEDPKNVNGGCWTAAVNRTNNSKAQLDAHWLNAVRVLAGALHSDHLDA